MFISNQRTDEMVGDLGVLDPEYCRYVGNQGQRMAWCMRDGDLLVLPMAPHAAFLGYVSETLGITPGSVDVLVPPEGGAPEGILSSDRLLDPSFLAVLRDAVAAHGIDEVVPFHFDSTISRLTEELGLADVTPGFGLLDQGGGRLLNSKATFRALAAGAGVPVPDGFVCDSRKEVERYLWERFLSHGHPAILKQDYHVAGFGNEVISPFEGVDPVGALRSVVTRSRDELAKYLADRWHWLTDGGRNRIVAERYFENSTPLCAEFRLTDDSVVFLGHGEMRMQPVLNGHIWPAPSADSPIFPDFISDGLGLCGSIHALGYRGIVSVDAVLTTTHGILVNEFNCRVSGSTHAYEFGRGIVGEDWQDRRVIIEMRRCSFPPLDRAIQVLHDHGIAFDHGTRSGVVVAVEDAGPNGGYGEYLVVAESLAQAEELERQVGTCLLLS
ncbi:peptide ligase PGM1-related protein [Streptomyces macrosporus]|uniref:preATP grasp domain-containing protein n=1 Tax=Streptomyces macrosporus TaxID=44032 RepID=UPI0031CFCED8